jgi:hypothetical protein
MYVSTDSVPTRMWQEPTFTTVDDAGSACLPLVILLYTRHFLASAFAVHYLIVYLFVHVYVSTMSS